jgi:hypothetical protein
VWRWSGSMVKETSPARPSTWIQWSGACLIGSVILWFAAAVASARSAAGVELGILATALVLLLIGMSGVRHRTVGRPLTGPLVATSLLGVLAEVLGTTVPEWGGAVSIPVIAAVVSVLWWSRWRLGDLALLAMVLGMGMGLAYLIEAALHPDTGSYGDQGALLLAGTGAGLSWIVVGINRRTPAPARILVLAGSLLAIVALVAGSSVSTAAYVAVGLPALVFGGAGFVAQGADMWSSRR